ncbi:MAG: beta-galactosidase [Clostridiales bacterium]|nr:MAG: beta-galactosidase [Clostridiales bacterium]
MDRLIKTGKIKTENVTRSEKLKKIGIGFEKLDRDVFDPEKAYGKLGKLGIKWVRIQSGWQRTETEKGIYNFEWLDKVVDNLVNLGVTPWICLCYGNALYGGMAKRNIRCGGLSADFHRRAKTGLEKNYVSEVVKNYEERVSYFEIWNEPDGEWCWKHGVSGTELGIFTRETAQTIKSTNPNAKTIGGALCLRPITFINDAFATGMGEYLDFISFHEYTADETLVFERVKALKALAQSYNPNIDIIQGESGSQSRGGGHGALWRGCWTPEKQAKQLARHTIADLYHKCAFRVVFFVYGYD